MIDQNDPGYSSYQDPRLQPPMEEEPQDGPLTEELRRLLDVEGVRYECGWVPDGGVARFMADFETTVHANWSDLTVFEEEGTLWLSLETEDACDSRTAAALMTVAMRPSLVGDLRRACRRLMTRLEHEGAALPPQEVKRLEELL